MFSLIKECKLIDLTVKNIVSTNDSVKRQITDSISENLTDSDLKRTMILRGTTSLTAWKTGDFCEFKKKKVLHRMF